MDAYGSMTVCQADADEVYQSLAQGGSCVFPLASGDGGALIVLLCSQFEKLGIMPFGGNPVGRIYVGLYGRGCNHLSTEEIHPGYIEEKLGIPRVEAEEFSKFWTLLWKGRGTT